MPSVRNQFWGGIVEHIIISDMNPELRQHFRRYHDNECTRFIEINDTWKNIDTCAANGAFPWMVGSRLAFGTFVGFLGDDDELYPEHVSVHVGAMTRAGALWSLSQVEFRAGGEYWNVIGDESYIEGHLDATGIMCHRTALRHASWDPAAGIAAVDWKLVNDWRQLGVPGIFVARVTGIHHDGWLTGMTGKPYSEEPWAGQRSR